MGDDVFVLLAGDTPTDLVVDGLGRREVLRRAEKEWCDGTLAQHRSAATTFAAHVEIDTDSIPVKSSGSTSTVDPRTILTPDEFHEMREADGTPRDRCLVDVLEYTGRRFRVIQTL